MHCSYLVRCFTPRRNAQLTLLRALSYFNPFGSKNYYKTLGLETSCTPKEVRDAYIRLSKEYHPDKNPNALADEKRFVEINEAYSVLSKPATRRKYDCYLGTYGANDQEWSSSYDELTYRYNQFHRKQNRWEPPQEPSKPVPLHKMLLVIVGAMFFVGLVEFHIVRRVVQGPDEVIDGVPIYHSNLVGPNFSPVSEEQKSSAYKESKRLIIESTVRSMKAEQDSRQREQERLRNILENGAQRHINDD